MSGSNGATPDPEPGPAWESDTTKNWNSGKCPVCGSKDSVMKRWAEGEKLQSPDGAPIDMEKQELVVFAHHLELDTPVNPRRLVVGGDVCWDCGACYALLAHKATVVPAPSEPSRRKLITPL